MKKTKTNKASKKTIGIIQAIIVAFHQGFEGVLLVLFGITTIAVAASTKSGEGAAWGAAVLGAKEMLALSITVILVMIKRGPKFFKDLYAKLKTKQGVFFILAGVVGTSMGNLFYILGIVFAGAGYGVVLTALYPIFSMLLVKFVMKETENKMVWLGASIAVVSGFLLILLPALLDKSSSGDITKQIIGMIFGLLAAFFWALEGLFINLGLKTKLPKKQSRFTSIEIVMTRNIFTTIVTVGLVMPVMCSMAPSFSYVGDIFSNWQALLIILAIAANIIILRHFHVKAINNIGAKLTAIIDTNNFIVPALMAQIFVAAAPIGLVVYASSTIVWWAYILMIPVMLGVFMVLYFHEEQKEDVPLDFVNWHQDVENDEDEFTI